MKKVSEVAEILGVSRKTIYRKIDQLSLKKKGFVTKRDSVTMIATEGIEAIKEALKPVTEPVTPVTIEYLQQFSTVTHGALQSKIELLEKQLADKDLQIKELKKDKDELRRNNDQLVQMNQNTQNLLAMEKKEKQLLLELPQEPVRKSIWNIFRKSQPNSSWGNEGEL